MSELDLLQRRAALHPMTEAVDDLLAAMWAWESTGDGLAAVAARADTAVVKIGLTVAELAGERA